MWTLSLKNSLTNISFKTQYPNYELANKDFLNDLKHCRNNNDLIVFVNDNEFKSYRKGKLCVTCKINDSN